MHSVVVSLTCPGIPGFNQFGAKGSFFLSVGRFLGFHGQRQEVVNNHDIIDICLLCIVCSECKSIFVKIRNDVRKNKRQKTQ